MIDLIFLLICMILIQTVCIFTTVLIINAKTNKIKEMFEEVLRGIR